MDARHKLAAGPATSAPIRLTEHDGHTSLSRSGTIYRPARSPAKGRHLELEPLRIRLAHLSQDQREIDMAENAAKKSFEAGAKTAREALEKGAATTEQAAREAEHSFSSAGEGLRDFNAKLMSFGQANTMANLNFFAELARAKGPTEAFELWSRHAQEQMQRFTEQSQELGTLGQRIASTSGEPLRRSFDQTLRRVS